MKMMLLAAAIAAALISPAAPAYATETDVVCKSWGDFAKSVMTIRQRNVAMSVLMQDVATMKLDGGGSPQQQEQTREHSRQIVLAAYAKLSFSTEEVQQTAIAEFVNDIELACYSARNAGS